MELGLEHLTSVFKALGLLPALCPPLSVRPSPPSLLSYPLRATHSLRFRNTSNAHLNAFGFVLGLLGLQCPLYEQLLQFLVAVVYTELFETRDAGDFDHATKHAMIVCS